MSKVQSGLRVLTGADLKLERVKKVTYCDGLSSVSTIMQVAGG